MSLIQDIRHEHDYFVATLVGETTVDALTALAQDVRSVCEESEKSNVVLDCGNMTGSVSMGELYFVGVHFAETLPKRIKVAFINSPNHWEENEFSENVVANRGGALLEFESETAALGWFRE